MFKVASFDIGYNCIFDRPFILIFIAVIHTAYATIKMTGPRGVITLKSDQCDALTCENTSLTHAGRFDEQEVQNLAAKLAKTHGGGGNLRQDGNARTSSKGHTQNACSKEGHGSYPHINPAHHQSAGGR
jgi:hypothetical protein